MKLLVPLVACVTVPPALIGLIALADRVAGGPYAWMVGLPVATVGWIAAFALSERR